MHIQRIAGALGAELCGVDLREKLGAAEIVFWGNLAARHDPVSDHHGFGRRVHRVTLAGDRRA